MARKSNSTKKQISSSQDDQQIQLLQQGLICHEDGLIQKAKIIYKEILKKTPTHFHALHLLGLIASQEKNYTLAVCLITKAIEIYPDNAVFHSNKGVALQELKEFEAAISSFKKAISLQSDYADAYANCGNAFQGLKQFEAAIASYDKAISIQPSSAAFNFNR